MSTKLYYVKEESTGLIDGYYTTEIMGKDSLDYLQKQFTNRKFTLHSGTNLKELNDGDVINCADWYYKE